MFILDFWYESNSTWGRVRSFDDLVNQLKNQIEDNNGIDTIDDFLNKSRRNGDSLDFGTRIEHDSNFTLRNYLIEINCLNEFIIFYKYGV